jgi:uncharacterized protein (TIGR03437 family)
VLSSTSSTCGQANLRAKIAFVLKRTYLAILILFSCCPALIAQSVFGRNLIVNGGAEAGPSDPDGHHPIAAIPGWTMSGSPDVVQYKSSYDIGFDDILPLSVGSSYFYGGRPQANSSLSQSIDLSSGAATIDSGSVTFSASAFLGGYQNEPENAQMTVTFLDGAGNALGSATVGPVENTDRVAKTGLWYRRAIGQVPARTRSANVVLQMNWSDSSNNDGAADNLSLVLNAPTVAAASLGRNLIANGNADQPAIADPTQIGDVVYSVPGWATTGTFTIDSYTHSNADLDNNSPGPADRGSFYFYGGPGSEVSTGTQDIDLSSAANLVDGGTVTFALNGWIGGYSSQNDNTTLTVQFQNWKRDVLGTATLGPIMASDRNNNSALLQLSKNGGVPTGTRVIHVDLTMKRTDGSDNDGMADSLSLVLTAPGVPPALPAITGIVNDASFAAGAPISPGSWVAIFGNLLAPVQDERKWNETAEIVGGQLPVNLDGTSVTINGKPAVVEFISPGQVNIQPPDDASTGPVQVVVQTVAGSTPPFTVNYAAVAPGLFPATAPYIVAQHADNSYVSTFSPAKPGEVIILWGTGFGPAAPAVASGQVFTGSNPLANKVTVTIGGQDAAVDFAGVVGAGLVQINVHVPAGLPNGDAPVVATVQGISTQSTGNLISVHN